MSDDLTRLFGYQGAVPDGAADAIPDQVAPEIVRLPFWTVGFCDLVVRAAEAASREAVVVFPVTPALAMTSF